MRVLIIEDELPAQRLIEDLIKEIDADIDIVGCLNSIVSSVEWLKENEHPEIILLDIQLSDGLSFEIFKQVAIFSMIIFTTAYDEYAMQAFKVNSLDYLLKPIDKQELQLAFEKYHQYSKQFIREKNSVTDFSEIASLINSERKEYRKRFVIQSNESFYYLPVSEIAFFYITEGVTFAVTYEKREYLINVTLESLTEQLNPNDYFRVNRQFIININAIKRVHIHFNGKLKIETEPTFSQEILVVKNKVAGFKRWIDR